MGFSSITSHVLWFLAIVAMFGTVTDFWFDHQSSLAEARADRRDIDAERLHARLSAASWCYTGTGVWFNATNAGDVPLNATHVTFVIDGVPAEADSVESVDGGTSHLWLPDDEFHFNSTTAAEPDAVMVVTERGVTHFPVKLSCRMLTTIVITPASANLAIGESATFTVEGFDQYGDPYDGAPYTFTSDAGTVTVVDGTTATLTAGTTAGTSLYMRATSGDVSQDAAITVRPDPPASVTVGPDPANVAAGDTQQFTADVRDQYGNQNTTATVSWTTDAGTITSSGLLTAQTTAQDGLQVTATVGALQDSAVVNVVPGPVATVDVTPATTSVKAGQTATFTAAASDQYGNAIPDATFTWSATRGAVDASGVYTAPLTVGSDTVTATSDGVSGQAGVTVTADVHVDDVTTYKAGVESTTFVRGETVEVRVTVRDHNGNLVEGVTATVEFVRPNGQLDTTVSGATDATGIASISHTLPNGQPGTWTVRVSNLSGANFTYVSASNVETQVTIQVS